MRKIHMLFFGGDLETMGHAGEPELGRARRRAGLLDADINGDGQPDLVTPNVSTRNVSVLLGTANGMFQTPVSSSGGGSVGMLPQAVAVADFTGDGALDVVTADYNSNRLTLLVGNKTAAFGTGVSVGVVAGSGTIILPNYVISGDFNKDGKPDVAVPRIASMNNVVLLSGTGTQATPFGTPAVYTAGGNPYALVAGDWNGDGNLDLAANNSMTNNVTVLLGSANGMMTVSGTQLGVGMRPEHIATADA
jgi:hypothetical protein